MERFTIKVDTDTPLNLSLMCRLCGTNNTGNISVLNYNTFYIEDGDPELWKKILACVGIQVNRNDKMPQNICHLCHDKILDFFEFREMCLSINSQIRQMVGLPALVELKPYENGLISKKTYAKKDKKKPQKRTSDPVNINPKPPKLIKVECTNASSTQTQTRNTTKNKSVKKVTSGNILSSKGKTSTAVKDKDQKLDIKSESFISNIPVIELDDDDDEYDLKKLSYCNICDKKFNSIKYQEHLAQVHIPSIVPYHCITCNETITKRMEIKNHNLWHKLSKTPYKCGRCDKEIENLGTFTRHINECLTFDKSHILRAQKCKKCYQEFQTQNLYFWHPCVTSSLKCPKCYKSFTTQLKTTKHIVRCGAKPAAKTIKTLNSYNNQKLKNEVNNPLMDKKAIVMIPTLSIASTSNDKTNKKSKKLNKKDVERFDNLLKDAFETLQSIKQEPKDSSDTNTLKSNSNEEEQQAIDDNSDSYHNNDDGNDMATYSSDENDNPQPNLSVKQEIDINDTEFEKSINGANVTTTSSELENNQNVQTEQQPTIKLKIKMEHGTLNSSLIGGENGNSDLNSGDGSSDDANVRKRKKKRKRTDKEEDDNPGQFVMNIKQEPLDENILTEQQNATETAGEETLNSNLAPLLPVISGVTSLAASELTENSELSLPIISAVHSEVEMPNTLENRNLTISGVVIKQEVIDEAENNDLQGNELTSDNAATIESNETVASEVAEAYRLEADNLLSSKSTMSKDGSISSKDKSGLNPKSVDEISKTKQNQNDNLSLDMEMVRIKKEIDYEEYANETYDEQNTQNCNDNYENENSFVTSNVAIKEEIHLNYENEYYNDDNLMDYYDHNMENNGDNNMDGTTTTTSTELRENQHESQDQNVTEEKENEKDDNATANMKSNDLTQFSFKKILLKSSNTNTENLSNDKNVNGREDRNDDDLEHVNAEEINKEINCTLDLENTSNVNKEMNTDSHIEDESSKLAESSEIDKQTLEEENTIEEEINSQEDLSLAGNNLDLQKSFNKNIENKSQDGFTITSVLCGTDVDKFLNFEAEFENNENDDNVAQVTNEIEMDVEENSKTCNTEESVSDTDMEDNQSNLESNNITSTSNKLNEVDSNETTSQEIFENEQMNVDCREENENKDDEDITNDNNNLLQTEISSNLDETVDKSEACEKTNEIPIPSTSSHLKNDTILLNNIDTNKTDDNQNSSNTISSNSNVLITDNINEIAENNNNENIEKELKNNHELEEQQELRNNDDNVEKNIKEDKNLN